MKAIASRHLQITVMIDDSSPCRCCGDAIRLLSRFTARALGNWFTAESLPSDCGGSEQGESLHSQNIARNEVSNRGRDLQQANGTSSTLLIAGKPLPTRTPSGSNLARIWRAPWLIRSPFRHLAS